MAVLVSYVREINKLLGTRYFELYDNEQQKKKNHELLYKNVKEYSRLNTCSQDQACLEHAQMKIIN